MKESSENTEGPLSIIMEAVESDRFIDSLGGFKVKIIPEGERITISIAHPFLSWERLVEFSKELEERVISILHSHGYDDMVVNVNPQELPRS